MSELIVVAFDGERKAESVRVKLLQMEREHLVDLEDAVVAVRKADGSVRLHQIHALTPAGALAGGFWGALIGLIFASPWLGLAVGAATGGVVGALSDVGVNDQFMKDLAATLKPGTSALFVLIRKATTDKMLDELKPFEGKVLKTSLSHEDEAKLQAVLEATGRSAAAEAVHS